MPVADFPPIHERRLARLRARCEQLHLTAADLHDPVEETVRLVCQADGCQGGGACDDCVQESLKLTGQDLDAQLTILADTHSEAALEALLDTLGARVTAPGRLSDAA